MSATTTAGKAGTTTAAEKPLTRAAVEPKFDWDQEIAEPEIDGWYDAEHSGVVIGQICGFKVINTVHGKQDVVIVALKGACKAMTKEDGSNDLDLTTLEPGKNIAIGIRSKLVPLLEYVETKAVIRLESTEKIKIKGGKTMWKFKIQAAKGSKKGAPPRAAVNHAEDIPAADDF